MNDVSPEAPRGLRVILYSVLPIAYQVLTEWAARYEHRVVLVVTTPGPPARRSGSYREVVAMSPPEQDILITTRMKRTAPLIAALRPDLVVSFTFPYRIPPEVTTAPRHGAVNLHPAPLPLYRGPNPLRAIFDGAPTLGATLHWIAEDFDTGNILSLHERPMPEDVTPENLFPIWRETMVLALDEGSRRAVAGDPGMPQDHARATYAAQFTDADRALDWHLPMRVLQRRTTAVSLLGPGAIADIDGKTYTVRAVTPVPDRAAPAGPGSVLDRADGAFTLCAADGVVRVSVQEA